MKFIGICGLKGSGKDTIADFICNYENFNNKNFNIYKVSFATSLKRAMTEIFGYSFDDLLGTTTESRKWREEVDEYWSKELGRQLTPRQLMQIIGTDLLRNQLSKNIWVASLYHRCELQEKSIGKECTFLVPDCRFPNEIEFIENHGGKIIEVYREWPINKLKISDLHESEISFMNVAKNPIRIINDSTLENLQQIIFNKLKERSL